MMQQSPAAGDLVLVLRAAGDQAGASHPSQVPGDPLTHCLLGLVATGCCSFQSAFKWEKIGKVKRRMTSELNS